MSDAVYVLNAELVTLCAVIVMGGFALLAMALRYHLYMVMFAAFVAICAGTGAGVHEIAKALSR